MNPNPTSGAPANAAPSAATSPTGPAGSAPRRRRRALLALSAVVAVIGGGYLAYEFFVGSRYESTDNAYVQGNLVQITPQIAGTVTAILADDTDFVKAGQPLVRLDPADARLALQHAEAGLAQAVRQAGLSEVPDHPLVQAAMKASAAAGFTPRLDESSTDSNIPMSMGIPALTIGTGAGGGRTHSTDEYLDVGRERFLAGVSVGLAVILAQAQADVK